MSICGISDIELHFESSGIKIRPIEVDSYENSDQFDYAKVRVTRDAAEYIKENHKPREAVSLVSNGSKFVRYMIPEKDDTITTTEETGYIRLEDDIKVLAYKNVNKSFAGTWKVSNVVQYLYNLAKQNDPEDVLTGWDETNVSLDDIEALTTSGTLLTERGLGTVPIISNIAEYYTRRWRNNLSILKDDVNLDFEDVSVLEALTKIGEIYQFSVFITMSGELRIGFHEDRFDIYPAGFDRNSVALIGLSAPNPSDPIGTVRVRGAAKRSSQQKRWKMEKNDTAVRAEGAAVRTDIGKDGLEIFADARTTYSGETLERIARRKLESTIGKETGSCTVDVLSTGQAGIDIKEATLGDYIFVTGNEKCRRPIKPGLYKITGIHHKLSNWVGWNAILDLEDANMGTINTKSYFFDPTSEKFITEDGFENDIENIVGSP